MPAGGSKTWGRRSDRGRGSVLHRQRAAIQAEPLFRQVSADDRAFAGLAVDLDRAAMQLDQPLRQRQAEPNAVMLPGQVALDLPERRQCYRDLVRRHADAGVLDPQGDAAMRRALDLQSDLAAWRR